MTFLYMGTVHTFIKEAIFCTMLFYSFFKKQDSSNNVSFSKSCYSPVNHVFCA